MTSLAMGLLCKPSSNRYSAVLASSSSTAKGAQARRFLQLCRFDKNCSMTFQQRRCNTHINQNFHEPLTHEHGINNKKFKLNAASSDNLQSEATYDLIKSKKSIISFLDVLYRFIRPYAAVGMVLKIVSISFLTVEKLSDASPLFFMKMLQALVGCIFMQMYVSGLNQICDIELDKVNKPYLPLAARELSMETAVSISSLSAIVGLLIAWIGSPPLFWSFAGWFLLGTVYSANLPLMGWKRYPLTAAFCIVVNWALVVPIGCYLHMKNPIHGGSILSRPILFAAGMIAAFATSTTFFKDIPDIKGDRMHGIKSLAYRLGEKGMFWTCIWIIEFAFAAAAFVGATSSITWSKYITDTNLPDSICVDHESFCNGISTLETCQISRFEEYGCRSVNVYVSLAAILCRICAYPACTLNTYSSTKGGIIHQRL